MYMSLRRCERRSPPSSGCARRRASSCCGRSRASRSRSWRRSRRGCASAHSRPSRCSSRSRATRARCACPPLTPWHHHDWWWRIRWRARHQLSHLRAPAPPSAFCRSAAPLPPLRRERMPLPPCPCPLCHLVEPLLRSARPPPCAPVALPGRVGRRAAQARERRRGRRRATAWSNYMAVLASRAAQGPWPWPQAPPRSRRV